MKKYLWTLASIVSIFKLSELIEHVNSLQRQALDYAKYTFPNDHTLDIFHNPKYLINGGSRPVFAGFYKALNNPCVITTIEELGKHSHEAAIEAAVNSAYQWSLIGKYYREELTKEHMIDYKKFILNSRTTLFSSRRDPCQPAEIVRMI